MERGSPAAKTADRLSALVHQPARTRSIADPATVEPVATAIDLAAAYRLHPNVAVRPEPFGALVYHYGNRKLVFLKSPRMVAVVKSLDEAPSVRSALETNGVAITNTDRYLQALSRLLASDMLIPVDPSEVPLAR